MGQPGFWENQEKARVVVEEMKGLKALIAPIEAVHGQAEDAQVMLELAKEAGDPESMTEFEAELVKLQEALARVELMTLLSGKNDAKDSFFSIQAGAGGTEACDWVDMLLRMYQRWAEKKGFSTEIMDILPGEEAGVKRVTFIVKGNFAYGLLQSEAGVHRLVRISPFDSNARRHTSFAASDVVPEIDDSIEITVNEVDLRIDTFRSSGAGGQHVNRTESAIRITHLPTNTVVQCQNERSQFKNKATAMKMLKSKLYDLELEKQRAAAEKHYDAKGDIAWGNQIRSYVFMPYQMVKDLRSGYETSQISNVMDGELEPFINAYLEWKLSGDKPRRSLAEKEE
jgi:peptide chain release factor 2